MAEEMQTNAIDDRLDANEEKQEELQFAIDETAGEGGIIENLEAIAINLESILLSGGSLDSSGFKMYGIAMRSNMRRIGLDYKDQMPSMEMFDDAITSRGATRIAMEGVFSAIGDALKKVWEWITGIFKSSSDSVTASKAKNEAAVKKIEEVEAKVEAVENGEASPQALIHEKKDEAEAKKEEPAKEEAKPEAGKEEKKDNIAAFKKVQETRRKITLDKRAKHKIEVTGEAAKHLSIMKDKFNAVAPGNFVEVFGKQTEAYLNFTKNVEDIAKSFQDAQKKIEEVGGGDEAKTAQESELKHGLLSQHVQSMYKAHISKFGAGSFGGFFIDVDTKEAHVAGDIKVAKIDIDASFEDLVKLKLKIKDLISNSEKFDAEIKAQTNMINDERKRIDDLIKSLGDKEETAKIRQLYSNTRLNLMSISGYLRTAMLFNRTITAANAALVDVVKASASEMTKDALKKAA